MGNQKAIVYMFLNSLAIYIALLAVLSASCSRESEYNGQYIEPLGLYFSLREEGRSVKVSFGKKTDSVYPNFFETWHISSDIPSTPFYFVVDNASGTPEIRHIFFNEIQFFDIHIPDYRYSINYFMLQNTFDDHVEKLAKIDADSLASFEYYLVEVWRTEYDVAIDYRIYDMGDIEDIKSYIASFVDNSPVSTYRDQSRIGVKLGYQENVAVYGEPSVSKRFTITDENRKEMIKAGWLFLDTLDISDGPVLEIDKWKVDDDILSIIYRVGQDGERTPVNGARYIYGMERRKDRIYYQ